MAEILTRCVLPSFVSNTRPYVELKYIVDISPSDAIPPPALVIFVGNTSSAESILEFTLLTLSRPTYERRKTMNAQSIIPPNIDYGKISADKYSPDDTYEAGELRIQYNSLWKSNQKIPVPEPWTPAHWDQTTVAAELSALNSSIDDLEKVATLYSPASPISFPGEIDVDITAYRVVCMAVYSGSTASSNRQHVLISTYPETAQYIPVQLGTTASYIRIEYASGKLSLLSSGAPASVGAIYGIVK